MTRIGRFVHNKFSKWPKSWDWGNLKWLGNSRLVKTSYLWFVVVPLFAKLLLPFAGEHAVNVPWIHGGKELQVTVGLPFSWKMFWFMSVAFLVGRVVYYFACPEVVQKYSTYGEYRADHAGPSRMRRHYHDCFRRIRKAEFVEFVRAGVLGESRKELEAQVAQFDDATPISEAIWGPRCGPGFLGRASEAELSRSFDGLIRAERRANRTPFWVCATSFSIGLVLAAILIIQNIVAFFRVAF